MNSRERPSESSWSHLQPDCAPPRHRPAAEPARTTAPALSVLPRWHRTPPRPHNSHVVCPVSGAWLCDVPVPVLGGRSSAGMVFQAHRQPKRKACMAAHTASQRGQGWGG